MTGALLRTFDLGTQWPTIDPFLFCAHHLDRYPAADGALAPRADLRGRSIGNDFSGAGGWNMYHGDRVPGFPQHPHRGFETVTYVRRGWCDHSDSLGARARFGEGDVQWLTAGAGIVHSEMFPLFDPDGPNTLHLFQIWLNLPRADKMVAPYFSMLWREQIPTVPGVGVDITVIAGSYGDVQAPAPPPDSWASHAEADVGIWHLRFDVGGRVELPPAAEGVHRAIYVFDGDGVTVGGDGSARLGPDEGALVDATAGTAVESGDGAVECLVLQGRPIAEPVAQYGPFVMNDRAGIEQAFDDYRRTSFGGWPWPEAGPVHGLRAERFSALADGTVARPGAISGTGAALDSSTP